MPPLKKIFEIFSQTDDCRRILNALKEKRNLLKVSGLSRTISLFLLSAIKAFLQRPLVYISSNQFQISEFVNELRETVPRFSSELGEIIFFPDYEGVDDPYTAAERLGFFSSMFEQTLDKSPFIVAPVKSFLRLLPSISEADFSTLNIDTGTVFPFERTVHKLLNMGYKSTDLVLNPGEFSQRGGIIDVYPPTLMKPVRIEWWGDEVDEIREFEPSSQRSHGKASMVHIGPAREFICERTKLERGIEEFKVDLKNRIAYLKRKNKKDEAEFLQDKFIGKINGLLDGSDYSLFLNYPYYFFDRLVPAFDCIPENVIVCLEEPPEIRDEVKSFLTEEKEMDYFRSEQGLVLPEKMSLYINWEEFTEQLSRFQILELYSREEFDTVSEDVMSVNWKIPEHFRGQINLLADSVKSWLIQKQAIVLMTRHSSRLKELLSERSMDVSGEEPEEGRVVISKDDLPEGFSLPAGNIIVLTEHEIFGKGKVKRDKKSKSKKVSSSYVSLHELNVGDYVVHEDYGIALYKGVEMLTIEGVNRDFISLVFAKNASLYIPVEDLNKITRYIGGGEGGPKLSRLGTSEWKRSKGRVLKSVKNIADDLIKLYAVRQTAKGYSFPEDTEWLKQMEDSFIYEETEDQRSAILEVKKDMMDNTPMDRLICGDVGYGKTEVAIRAAFKAMNDGKQALMLVPTTVLAQQHYNTFTDRLAPYPFKIEMLSRFKSPTEQKEIIRALQDGMLDMVIGTHRLLQKDVKLSDPGLLIIDEEQRFGVAHKEKLKKLRESVDVLTLTATPIPRTLYMSMLGVRDISVIETPPEDRLPVKTYLLKRSEKIIKEAISREIARGGQIFYLHNRVEDIDREAYYLKTLFPRVTVGIGHGQMDEQDLEQVMYDFVGGLYQILVCTTIIESGLDIPNANTLIVNSAERFGLAQLYQLRGRVGRSTRQAYAYLFYNPDKTLSENAFKRLEAISELTDLGSGYQIALKDLEIRGAGNLLGSEQHGFISQIGFELYCQLLNEAVEALKGEETKRLPMPVIDVTIDAYIPDDYISHRRQKLAFYKRLSKVQDHKELSEITEELIDRFGNLPKVLENLINLSRIKLLAGEKKIERIKIKPPKIIFSFFDIPVITKRKLADFSKEFEIEVSLTKEGELLAYKEGIKPLEMVDKVEEILVFLLEV